MREEQFAIYTKGIKKAYKDKEVLKGVDFEIATGSIFCLLGSNGSGKTTTIKILSTLLQKDEGIAMINGYDIEKDAAKVRRSIALTGQFTAVDDILTARENMEIVARLAHVKAYKRAVKELLQTFNLLDVADKRVETYSGGMKRRLDIAMSLLGNPKVIFLDEPTTGLDPQSRIAMWDVVKSIKAQGVTIFLTTQYLEEAEQLADRVAILHDGVIVANDCVENMKAMYAQEYIQFTCLDEDSMRRMMDFASLHITNVDPTLLQITVELTEGIQELTTILDCIKKQNIQITSFLQKKASLEDIFLQFIHDKGEQDESFHTTF